MDPPRIVVRGKPSGEMADRLDREEKARVAAQKERLGPDGLAACERELEAAKKEHESEISSEILTSFPVPDVKSIAWIPVQSVQEKHGRSAAARAAPNNAELARHIEQDGTPLPFFVQYDHVKVCSISIYLLGDGSHLCIVRFRGCSCVLLPGQAAGTSSSVSILRVSQTICAHYLADT